MPISLGPRPEHGFDQPLGLLSDCHRRIEHFLGVLRKVVRQAGRGALDGEYRSAAETSLTYFRTAGPRHTADEEQSLFPLLRDSSTAAAQAALATMDSLHEDHTAAEAAHDQVDEIFRQWIDTGSISEPQHSRLGQRLDELTRLYEQHLAIEDKQLFPLAAQALNEGAIARLGQEMAARRGLSASRPIQQPQEIPPMNVKNTIDVRSIPAPQRHPLIFRTFEALAIGEALELVNDHDPFPLKNQFGMMKRGQFGWDYLQQGPELWRVRISRIAPERAKV